MGRSISIRRVDFLNVRGASVTLLRLIPQTGYSRAPSAANAMGRTGCWFVRGGVGTFVVRGYGPRGWRAVGMGMGAGIPQGCGGNWDR